MSADECRQDLVLDPAAYWTVIITLLVLILITGASLYKVVQNKF